MKIKLQKASPDELKNPPTTLSGVEFVQYFPTTCSACIMMRGKGGIVPK
jgi:hypothetical protein